MKNQFSTIEGAMKKKSLHEFVGERKLIREYLV